MGWFKGPRRGPRLGGDAIMARLADATGGADPYTFAYDAFGEDLKVHAYFVDDPVPHLLYCTYGVSNVASSQKVAGTQTELTLRVPQETFPPQWPADHLARMARSITKTGRDIEPGHHMSTPRWALPAYLYVADPVLGIVDAPTGRVRFTYAVGLTSDDYERVLRWDPVKFAGVLGEFVPLGLTWPSRPALCANAEARARVEEATAAEGSSISAMLAAYLDVEAGGIHLDPSAARALLRGARYRLAYGKTFALVNGETWLLFDPAAPHSELGEGHMIVAAPTALAHELMAVFDDAPGTYELQTAPLRFTVIDPQR